MDLFNGLAIVAVKTSRKEGSMTVTAESEGLIPAVVTIEVNRPAEDRLAPAVAEATVIRYETKDAADGGV